MEQELATVRAIIAECLRPAHFFVRPPLELAWEHVDTEELTWEIFHGRLLDAAQTRQKQTFEAWNLFAIGPEGRAAEPVLAVKLDWPCRCVSVTRGILSYVWEPYDAGGNVILTREVRKWVRELVAAVDLPAPLDAERLRSTLTYRLFQAVVGISRLPLTSIEAPLPAFTLGELAYVGGSDSGGAAEEVVRSHRDLLSGWLTVEGSWTEKAKLLETVLRSTPAGELADAALRFAQRWQQTGHDPGDIPRLVLTLFDEVALSPYTDFVDKTIGFLDILEEHGELDTEQHADLLGSLLRRIGRHLSAFDLVTFHHRGANYPDALLLDALLKAFLALIERRPELFFANNNDTTEDARAKRFRRRGLRQGWLLRQQYQGHPVPDLPTSPGENARVLPPEFPHVSEEQIVNPLKRTRTLFGDALLQTKLTPTGAKILRQSVDDLEQPAELQELGMALFLDRPLGAFKHPAEPDQTVLLSYEAFSRSLAERRLAALAENLGLLSNDQKAASASGLQTLTVPGMPLQPCQGPVRPGVPSLQDAFKVAKDFVLLRTTRRAAADFLAQYDVAPLRALLPIDWLTPEKRLLIAGSGSVRGTQAGTLRIFDSALQPRLELAMDAAQGYAKGVAGEFSREGLRVVRIWAETEIGERIEREVRQEGLWLRPRY